jgi:hypothetical protein
VWRCSPPPYLQSYQEVGFCDLRGNAVYFKKKEDGFLCTAVVVRVWPPPTSVPEMCQCTALPTIAQKKKSNEITQPSLF